MKSMIFALALTFAMTATAQTEPSKPASASDSAVQAMTGNAKKTRKKKETMCQECGKPESQCECKGHKKDDGHDHAKDQQKR